MHHSRGSSLVLFGMAFGSAALGAGACGDAAGQNLPECDSHQWSELWTPGAQGVGGGGGAGGGSSAQLAGFCLPRTPSIDAMGRAACVAVEMQKTDACVCDGATGRAAVALEHAPLVDQVKDSPEAQSAGWNCFCEVVQLTGSQGSACQSDASNMPVDTAGNAVQGFCYVDATVSPPLGNPVLTESCAATERRLLRFVGTDLPAAGASIYAVCADEQCD